MRLYRQIVVAAVGLLLVGGLIFRLSGIARDVPVLADLERLPVIIIDPGHGGVDGGAVGVDNIVEKDINLAISLTLRDMFRINGFEVIMTRDTDISIHDEGVSGTKQQKTSDLHNRLDLVNDHPGAVFISIHQNKFGAAKYSGAQMFYGVRHPDSQRLASILQENFIGKLQPDNTRQIKQAGKELYLMYNAECPSVLIECGFLSNPEEAHRLTEPEYQNQIAFVTVASVMAYLENPATPDGALQS